MDTELPLDGNEAWGRIQGGKCIEIGQTILGMKLEWGLMVNHSVRRSGHQNRELTPLPSTCNFSLESYKPLYIKGSIKNPDATLAKWAHGFSDTGYRMLGKLHSKEHYTRDFKMQCYSETGLKMPGRTQDEVCLVYKLNNVASNCRCCKLSLGSVKLAAFQFLTSDKHLAGWELSSVVFNRIAHVWEQDLVLQFKFS